MDTATTEIYTYRLTLSLHDALPISLPSAPLPLSRNRSLDLGQTVFDRYAGVGLADPAAQGIEALLHASNARSEEHSSDLQSLMRTSYAGFCLKTTHSVYTVNDKVYTT